MRIYLAAPLFTEAERAFNVVVARSLEADGHDVYLPQRDTALAEGAGRTTAMFRSNSQRWQMPRPLWPSATARKSMTEPPGRSGTYMRGISGLRTDSRIGQQSDEPINLMILESLSELSPTIEQLVHTIRYAERL
jgi:hypothetical protein